VRSTPHMIRIVLLLLFLLIPLKHAFGQGDFESYLADAVKAQSANDIRGAISAYQKALSLRQDAPEVWANLGLMQHLAGDQSDALKSFTKANQLQPKLFVPLLFLGIENLQLGNKIEAVHYLSIARQLHPNDHEVYLNLGNAYFDLKQFENASIAYRHATELKPADGEGWYRLGITYLEISEATAGDFVRLNQKSPYFQRLNAESFSDQDKLSQSAEVFTQLLTGSIFPPCTRSSFGFVLLRSGKASEAQSQFEQDLKSSGCSLAKLGMIRLKFANGEDATAFKSLTTLWMLDSGFIRTYASELGRGMTPEQNKVFDDSLAAAQASDIASSEEISVVRKSLRGERTLSVQSDPPHNQESVKTASALLAQTFYARGEYAKCVKSLLPTISSLPGRDLSLLAACAFYTGDFNSALASAKRLRGSPQTKEEGLFWSILAHQRLALLALAYAGEVEPNSVRLHELLAESYRDRERYAEAEAEYQIALGINPDEFAALVGAATNYLQELKIDLAREMIQKALVQRPSDAEANYIMGEVLISEHKSSEAESYLRAALSAKADLVPHIHALLGQVYASQGDTKRAIDEYKLGLSSDDDGSVHFQLGRLYQRMGEKELAANAFAESKTLNQRKRSKTISDSSLH
jgi:tetratricopeptide (TPR) repeat protein